MYIVNIVIHYRKASMYIAIHYRQASMYIQLYTTGKLACT